MNADFLRERIQCKERDSFLENHLRECTNCQKQLAFLLDEMPILSLVLGKETVNHLRNLTKSLMEKKQNGTT